MLVLLLLFWEMRKGASFPHPAPARQSAGSALALLI
jgi:hypothetical protein